MARVGRADEGGDFSRGALPDLTCFFLLFLYQPLSANELIDFILYPYVEILEFLVLL